MGVYTRTFTGESPTLTSQTIPTNTAFVGPRPWIDVRASPYNAVGDGVANDYTAISTALAAIPASGGTIFFPAGTYAYGTTITMPNDVTFWLSAGAILKWTGSTSGTMFTSATADPLLRAAIGGGGRIDPQTTFTGKVFDLHSPQFCNFDLEVKAASATSTIMRWRADATNASGYSSTRNAVYNTVPRLLAGTCGTFLDIAGQATGALTLNTFGHLHAEDVRVVGLIVGSTGYVDNNVFLHTRINLGADSIVGVDLGTDDASTNVYVNSFFDLAVDAFAPRTGCTGIDLRNADKTIVWSYYHTAFTGGTVLDVSVADSWYIVDTYNGGAASLLVSQQGWVAQPHSQQNPAYVTPYTPDLTAGDVKAVTLTGNITVNLPTNSPSVIAGQTVTFIWIQDGTGGRTVTYNGNYKLGNAAAMVTTASTATVDTFTYDGALWRMISRNTNE